jgi:hypothetical protein
MAYDNLKTVTKRAICKKIFTEPTSPTFKAVKETAKLEVLEKLKQALMEIEGINAKDVRSEKYYGIYLSFELFYSTKEKRGINCELIFDKEHNLCVNVNRENYPFNNTNQLITLKEALQKAAIIANERVGVLKTDKIKRDKIKEIKKKAIIAKTLELVQVPYMIDDSFTTKIIVFIRLSDVVRLEVNVPYSNYQIVLQNTQAAIQAMREFADKGIAINVRTSAATTPYYDWIKPN